MPPPDVEALPDAVGAAFSNDGALSRVVDGFEPPRLEDDRLAQVGQLRLDLLHHGGEVGLPELAREQVHE